MKNILLSFIILLFFCSVQSQTYYGKNLFGRLQTVNDSVCTVTFISGIGGSYSVDSCYIHKHGDTIFLATKTQWRCKVNSFDKEQTANNPWYSIVVKIYQYSYHNKKYEYTADIIGIYDSIKNSYILEIGALPKGNYIIVYKDTFFYYRAKCSFDKDRNYVVLENPNYVHGVIFNEFPLFVKGNRLIPIDKEKQAQCWLDNGFLFPKMKISKKEKKYNIINGYYIGLRNLPAEVEELKPLPHRYMKYLNNE